MLISFVVPIYNTEAYLAECINSILALEGGYDIEIVMVDDASTDDSEQIARSFSDPRIRYIRHEINRGAAFTIDEGLRLATGRYVARIDSDDRYLPCFLQRTVPLLEENPQVGLVYGDIRMIDTAGNVTERRVVAAHEGKPWTGDELDNLLQLNTIPAPTVLARREAWNDALPIPAAYSFNDWYLSLEIAKRWKICYCAEVLADYRIHPQNMHRAMISNMKGEEITLDILANYFSKPMRPHHDSRFRRKVYAAQYLIHAGKYFGTGLYADARRCYFSAIAAEPALLLSPLILRRVLGTCIGRKPYEHIKRLAIRVTGLAHGSRFDKLHLGCGGNVLPGWTNVDMVKAPDVINWDLSKPLPVSTSSVDFIYSEHFIEHLTKAQAVALLEECFRVLRPEGVLRLSTPDLRTLVSRYLNGPLDEWKDMQWEPQSHCDLLNEGMRSWGHQYVFDADELLTALHTAGFVDACRVDWRQSSHPALAGLECRPFHEDLIVEATKPPASCVSSV